MGAEHGRGRRDPVPELAQRRDDRRPGLLLARPGEVADVLQQDHRRSAGLQHLADVEEQRAAGLGHAALAPALGERLAGEARCQHVVLGDGHAPLRQRHDVAFGAQTPVALVDRPAGLVDLRGEPAGPARGAQGGVEPPDPGEEVYVGEGHARELTRARRQRQGASTATSGRAEPGGSAQQVRGEPLGRPHEAQPPERAGDHGRLATLATMSSDDSALPFAVASGPPAALPSSTGSETGSRRTPA